MKKVATALGATLIITGIAAIYLWQQLRTQREQNVATITHVTALESAQSAGSMPLPTNDGAQVAALVPGSAAQTAPAPPIAGAASGPPGKGANPLLAVVEQMRSSPEIRDFQRTMMRQNLEDEYSDVAKALNLRPAQVEKLLDLLTNRRLEQQEYDLGSQSAGKQDRAARAAMARSRAEKDRVFGAEMAALLGDSYPKWGEYQSAAADRQRAQYERMGQEQLRNTITSGGAPLTDAQFGYLNTALNAEQKLIDKESGAMTFQQQLQRLPETNRRLAEVAAPHLNPQQLDRYKSYLKQQEQMMSTMEAMGALPSD